MLTILQARLQQYVNRELPDVQAGFRNGSRIRLNCHHPLDHRKSKRISEKPLPLLHWLHKSLCVDHNKLWKIIQEMGIPQHLTCLLRNLYAGQEAAVRTGHGTMDWFQIGKRVHQGYIFNLYAEYIMWNGDRVKPKLESRLQEEIWITSDMQMTPLLRQRAKMNERASWWRETKRWLKTQHSENKDHGLRSHHFMGNRWGNSVRLYFLGLQMHCRWWLQPWN